MAGNQINDLLDLTTQMEGYSFEDPSRKYRELYISLIYYMPLQIHNMLLEVNLDMQ